MSSPSELGLLAALTDAAVARALARVPLNTVRLGTVISSDQLKSATVTVILDGDTGPIPIQVATPGWFTPGARVVILLVPPSGALIVGVVNGDYDPWHSASLVSGWVNFGVGNAVPGYRREGSRVYLRGVLSAGAFGVPAFVLPLGYRPPHNVPLPVVSNAAAGYLSILVDGSVNPMSGSATWFSLEGTSFSLEVGPLL